MRGPFLLAVVLALPLTHHQLFSQLGGNTGSVELLTYFKTAVPPNQGEAVCLMGETEPIGTIRSVYLLPHRDEYHDGWAVVMEIDQANASAISVGSIARSNPYEPCGVLINVIEGGPPVSYHTVLRGEVNYLAEVPYFTPPERWWNPAIKFLSIDIGAIWIELFGAGALVVASSAFLIRCAIRRTSGN